MATGLTYTQRLRQAQNIFAKNVCYLILYIQDSGYTVSFGEAWRSAETQAAHVKAGRSQTMDSQHLKRLAVDLNFFDGDYMLFSDTTRREKDIKIVEGFAEQWEAYHKDNFWGGRWKGLNDFYHFQMNFT